MQSLRKIFLLLLVFGVCATLWAQSDTARLTGPITDASGAVVPAATVSLTNVGTQRTISVQSDASGGYVVNAIPPGVYKLEVKATGFKGISQEVTLQTQQVASLDLQLQVGQTSDMVTVTADLPLVEAGSSNISDVVIGPQITQLPLNGRNFTQLATLVRA